MLPFKGAMTKDKKKDVPMPDMVIRDGIKVCFGPFLFHATWLFLSPRSGS